MIRQIRKFVNDTVFRIILNGLFNSKLIYGITVYGGIWNLPRVLNEDSVNSTPISKEEMRKLQVLQNTAVRLLLRKPRDTPVATERAPIGGLSYSLSNNQDLQEQRTCLPPLKTVWRHPTT